ncbi:amino acid permease [Drepanopeziza brunnea f. sp. 'multigermtubi' MB_m1]|uniref:Amino acid permease n=1 Tax=Marssonina brunnea f. sp. multigermtubi (strain MB_m1) TaxID=1072389 RepID=K1XHD2_MARBU|nr:amino acid permease [Drepanopeziza brunnea f. sp. 'multigermtubi' MB_m1]EKD20153.1 amino acid permease [Drepanopeziza brunnea f. sp. 'multigermtubi' MB_m1]
MDREQRRVWDVGFRITQAGKLVYIYSEVVFAFMKLALIVGLIIAGLVWKNPGACNTEPRADFVTLAVFISAAVSFGNIQVVAISRATIRNPRGIIPAAKKKKLHRVFFFYVLSIFVITCLQFFYALKKKGISRDAPYAVFKITMRDIALVAEFQSIGEVGKKAKVLRAAQEEAGVARKISGIGSFYFHVHYL